MVKVCPVVQMVLHNALVKCQDQWTTRSVIKALAESCLCFKLLPRQIVVCSLHLAVRAVQGTEGKDYAALLCQLIFRSDKIFTGFPLGWELPKSPPHE